MANWSKAETKLLVSLAVTVLTSCATDRILDQPVVQIGWVRSAAACSGASYCVKHYNDVCVVYAPDPELLPGRTYRHGQWTQFDGPFHI